MPAEIHLELFTDEAEHRIDAESFLTALDASLEVLRELDASVTGGKFHWYYTYLEVGSGISTVAGELTEETMAAPAREDAEREIESLYVNGFTTLAASAHMPSGFTRRAAEAALRMVAVLSDSVTQMATYAPDIGRVVVTERVAANLKELLGRGFTDVGAIEGKLETISLAGRPTFNVRDEVTGQSVVCALKIERLEEVKAALGRRVLVSGEVTYSKRGEPSEVSPVEVIRLLDETEPPTVEEVRGIERDITEGKPTGRYVRERFYGG